MRKTNRMLAVLLCAILLVSLLPTAAFAESGNAPTYNEYTYQIENYFDANVGQQMSSVNGHYWISGLFADREENVYLVLSCNKNQTFKNVEQMSVNLHRADGSVIGTTFTDETNPLVTTTVIRNKLTLEYPDGSTKVLSGDYSYVIAKAGTMADYAQSFYLTVDTGMHGWNIEGEGVEVNINLSYEISKTADKEVAYEGDTVTYTVEVSNTGDYVLSNIDVYDEVPAGLQIISVDGNDPSYNSDGKLVLEEDLSLAKQSSKTYSIKALVTDDVQGEVVTNTATVQSPSLLPLSDTADVLLNPYFDVVHQATGDVERIYMDEIGGTDFDITEPLKDDKDNVIYNGITEGYIYGGLAEDEDFDDPKDDVCGKELKPENGDTYYLREVDMHYLLPATLFVWGDNGAGGFVTDTYLATDIDEDGVSHNFYQQYGFLSGDEKFVGSISVENDVKINDNDCELYPTITVCYANKDDTLYEVLDVFPYEGIVSNDDYFGCHTYTISEEYETFSFTPYFVTADNVLVPGVLTRTVGANTAAVQRPKTADNWSNLSTRKYEQPKARMFVSARSFAIAPVMSDSRVTVTMMDGEAASTCKVEPGNYTGKLAAAEKEGFLFAGWYADAELTVPADLSDVQADITVYAKYISDSYCELKLVKANGAKKYDAVVAMDSAYAQVGYIFAANGSEKKVPMSVTESYGAQAIFGEDVAADALVYCDNLKANKLPKNTAITLTPYFVLADGTVLYGEAQTYFCSGSELAAVND